MEQNTLLSGSWGLILGGSSGMGLASAKKLARHGMNICIVHRDRRGSMARIERDFAEIRSYGVQLETLNSDALSQAGRTQILEHFTACLRTASRESSSSAQPRMSLILHSIALGNLKPVAPSMDAHESKLDLLADATGLDSRKLRSAMKSLVALGHQEFAAMLGEDDALFADEQLGEEDFAQTLYNMGTSLMFWVQDLHQRQMLAADTRVIGLTSEGNQIAWRGYAAISAAKGALEAVARSIAREFAVHGIRCNILQPGVTDTPALRLIPGSERLKFQALQRNPFARLTTPEDVANAVYLLALKEAAWINGALIRVDGGEAISN